MKILTVAFVTGSWSLQRDFSLRRGTFWYQSECVKEHKIEIVQSNKTAFVTVETLTLCFLVDIQPLYKITNSGIFIFWSGK